MEDQLLEIESKIWDKGFNYIACIDEVGRGCLAGSVVACAIIMPKNLLIEGVNDSKKLTPKKKRKAIWYYKRKFSSSRNWRSKLRNNRWNKY